MTATDIVDLNSPGRRFWRTGVVVGLAALVIGLTFPNVFISSNKIFLPVYLGANWIVTAVYSPADAWLRVGDRIDPVSLTPDGRLTLTYQRLLSPGEILHLTVERSGQRKAISIQVPSTPTGSALVAWVKRLTSTIFIILAALLVLLRPCKMTWGFFFFALGNNGGNPYVVQEVLPAIYNAVWLLFNSVLAAFGVAGLWVFASRFPSDSTSGWRSYVDQAAPFAGLVGLMVNGLASFALLVGWHSLNSWNVGSTSLNTTFFAVGMLSLVGGYFRMTSSQRQRLKWVVGGFAIYLVAAAYQQIASYLPGGGWPEAWVPAGYTSDILNGLIVFIPTTVAYAVLKHHVLDVNFVISRALVIGTLTTALVGAFALVDWFFTKTVQQHQLAVYAEVGVALGFGFGLNGMHRRVDALIDRVLFRRRHLAEARLERIASGISHAISSDGVDAALVKEPADAFQLTSAAIFRRQDGKSFIRAAAVGWPNDTGQELHPNDPIVLHMQGERGPMRLRQVKREDDNFPKDAASPIIAFPLLVRHQLEGLTLYGAHVTGEDIDPDETRTLERLSASAAAAYDHLEADALRYELEQAKRRIESLELAQESRKH